VIDASIARAAGSHEATHPTGKLCRDFLQTVRGVCHRMAWNASIKAEWDKHQSAFAKTWFVSMFQMRKVRPISDEPNEDFREAIRLHSPDSGVVEAMLKDAHLIEAAQATDQRVGALDETVRGHFGRMSATFEALQMIVWANPVAEGEPCLEWLRTGADAEPHRLLRPTLPG
jgi:hypothetical protein